MDPKRKSQFGQFFTPASIARFMAEMFDVGGKEDCRLLDPGAGIGSLSAAFLDRWVSGGLNFRRIELHAFEIDKALLPYLNKTLAAYEDQAGLVPLIRNVDFVHAAADSLFGNLFAAALPGYTHAILNPPYKKIRSDSAHRAALRKVGIETVNLYSAFVALSLSLLDDQGELVAIIPRSFCNGPYYRPFRNFMLEQAVIKQIHLFSSRNKAFKDDDVLQENIIIRLERGGRQGPIRISTSTDESFDDLTVQEYPLERIIFPDDPERFIRVPTSFEINAIESSPAIRYSLNDLNIRVSTGPVVDFRVKEHLRQMPEAGTVPLLYPGHFSSKGTEWPKPAMKKPNAIRRNSETEKWLYPNGCYCVVRRFSSKEERRRVVANIVDPSKFGGSPLIGFENHLNVFHQDKKGLPKAVAAGLAVFLNTTAVDENFRAFNGHTQVNATDLNRMRYPSRETLIAVGEWALGRSELSQETIDEKLEGMAA
ncbi:MAG: Eco57I restriction-modification methylase domain-containing protein [Deltaproteobacteria bacterium]|nr:Eco57I restriction-modification methylase domain-containing protein [Deltaproteobacteria bacterium]